jgi:hypothetical protein
LINYIDNYSAQVAQARIDEQLETIAELRNGLKDITVENECMCKSIEASTTAMIDQQDKITALEARNIELESALTVVVHELQQWNLTEGEPESVEALRIANQALSTQPTDSLDKKEVK